MIFRLLLYFINTCCFFFLLIILISSLKTCFFELLWKLNIICLVKKPFIKYIDSIKCSINDKYDNDGSIDNEESIDVIVIGSGLSGLTVGGIMAKYGKRVVVFEKHEECLGGMTHSFYNENNEYKFDPGIHSIGDVSENSLFKLMFDYITNGNLEFNQDSEVMDVCVNNEIVMNEKNVIHFKTGIKNYYDELIRKFPEEKEGIIKYVKYLYNYDTFNMHNDFNNLLFLIKLFPKWIYWLINLLFGKNWRRIKERSLKDILDECFKKQEIKDAVSYLWHFIGTHPNELNFPIYSIVNNHFIYGSSHIKGGSCNVSKSIIPIIKKAGGKVFCNAGVKRILFKKKTAIGVELLNGDKYYSNIVVSSCIAKKTYLQLIPTTIQKYIPKRITEVRNAKNSISFYYLFIGIKNGKSEFGLKDKYYHLLSKDWSEKSKQFLSNDEFPFHEHPPFLDFSFQNMEYNNNTICSMLCITSSKWFEKYRNEKHKRRGNEYEELKSKITKYYMKYFIKNFPLLESSIEYIDSGSSITSDYYFSTEMGEAYGMVKNLRNYSTFHSSHPSLNNLFFTGADTYIGGFVSALSSGYLTASSILKRNFFLDFISNKQYQKYVHSKRFEYDIFMNNLLDQ